MSAQAAKWVIQAPAAMRSLRLRPSLHAGSEDVTSEAGVGDCACVQAAQAVATQCSKRVRALQEARKGDAPCPPQGRRPFPFDDDDELEEVYTLGGGDATFQSGVIQLLQRASNADASSEPPMESIPEAEEEELGEVEGELEEFEAAEAEVQAQVSSIRS